MTEVSALVIVRNGEAFIGRAIESILGQTVLPDEIVVVDGDSATRPGASRRAIPVFES